MLAAVSEHCTPQKVRFEEMARVYVFRWPAGSQMEGRQGGPQGLVDALSPISISEWKEIKMFNMRLILIREWHGAGWSCDFPPLHVICCLTPSHCTNLKPYMCEHEHVCVCASTHVCVHVLTCAFNSGGRVWCRKGARVGEMKRKDLDLQVWTLRAFPLCVPARLLRSCLTFCNPMGCSLLSMTLFRQEYWSGLPRPSPGDRPDPEIEPWVSCVAGRLFTVWATSKLKHQPKIQKLDGDLWWRPWRWRIVRPETGCYGLICVSTSPFQNSYTEALTPKVMVLGDRILGR